MKIPFNKKDELECPRIQETVFVRNCKNCKFLGIVYNGKVTCRWTKEKEQFLTKERRYEIFNN